MKVKPIEWGEGGFGHTPVGLTFRVRPDGVSHLLERFEGCSTIKSLHKTEVLAKQFAFSEYEAQVLSCIVDEAAERARKAELIAALSLCAEESALDAEGPHLDADSLLIEYINDPEIAAAFQRVEKWYA